LLLVVGNRAEENRLAAVLGDAAVTIAPLVS